MSMRLAIHPRTGSFSDRWLELCRERGIEHQEVNCFASDIIEQLAGCDALLWHPAHYVPADVLLARQLNQAVEHLGLLVYPDTATYWHFDDKLAQKYLLESIDAPLIPTHAFFRLDDTLSWIEQANFPKVFKLRRGAGSQNVRIVRDAAAARRLARQAFGKGFKPVAGYMQDASAKFRRHRKSGDLLKVLRRAPGALRALWQANHLMPRERGYVLFQDFVPGNRYDTRITVIGDRAFGFTRNVRPNDFRASGSGDIEYDLGRINMKCVELAFAAAGRIKSQSIAFDFVTYPSGEPGMVEISYAFAAKPVYDCPGYWDQDLNWHEKQCWPQDAILNDMLEQLVERGGRTTARRADEKSSASHGAERGE